MKRALAALALVAASVGGTLLATYEDKPWCPTEDSCHADYRQGEWHIEEVTP